jgi:hypothetical protein
MQGKSTNSNRWPLGMRQACKLGNPTSFGLALKNPRLDAIFLS